MTKRQQLASATLDSSDSQPVFMSDTQLVDHHLPMRGRFSPIDISLSSLPYGSGLWAAYAPIVDHESAPFGLLPTTVADLFVFDSRPALVRSNLVNHPVIANCPPALTDAVMAASASVNLATARMSQAIIELETAETRLLHLVVPGIRIILPLELIPAQHTAYKELDPIFVAEISDDDDDDEASSGESANE